MMLRHLYSKKKFLQLDFQDKKRKTKQLLLVGGCFLLNNEELVGFFGKGNMVIYFKGTRDIFGINLRDQVIFLLLREFPQK